MPDGGQRVSRRPTPMSKHDARVDLDEAVDAAAPPPTAASSGARRLPLMRRSRLAERIAAGETLVLHADKIYKLDAWLPRHPGGELAILHFVGRDAQDEIEAYHSEATLRRMKTFAIASLDPLDAPRHVGYKPLTPPVQLGYRSGKLDHPDAQWRAWQQARGVLDAEEREVEDLLAGARAVAEMSVHPKPNGDDAQDGASRPHGFPLPVALLEPPAPPDGIDAAKEHAISIAYRDLHEQVKAAGLYTLRPVGYARELVRYATLFVLFVCCYARGQFLLSSLFLGLFWHQVTFSAHDAGHTGITGVHAIDRAIGILIASPIGGLSIGWWCDNHDVHHLVTNHPEHDPDIQHMPFFAISPSFLVETSPSSIKSPVSAGPRSRDSRVAGVKPPYGLWSSYYRRVLLFDAPSRFFLRHQHALYYIVMSLGRFNLYANSYGFLAKTARFNDLWWWAEVTGVAVFWSWFTALLHGCPDWKTRIGFLLVSHIATSPLHVQIVLSHFAQSSEDLGLYESFASRQVRTTMDVKCPPQLDFLHGGLHMQVSHHLFPRIPRHNLREVRDKFVRPFCKEHGLRYTEYGFVEGNGLVRDTLRNVAGQVKLLGKVAKAQARGELH